MTERDPLEERLLPGERLLWSGRPAMHLLLSREDVLVITGIIGVWGLYFVWAAVVVHWGAGASVALLGLPVPLLVMLYHIGYLALDAALRRNTRYALTDKRVLILRTGRFSGFKAVPLERLPRAEISEGKTGSGTIRFENRSKQFNIWRPLYPNRVRVRSLDPTPQFLAIPEARKVFDLVQATAARHR